MKRTVTRALMEWKTRKRRKPLLLRGARQVGKTYSLHEFGEKAFSRYHYVNFEQDERVCTLFDKDLSPTRILEELQFYFDASIDKETDLVIFDEIQHCPRALTVLKYFYEQIPAMALCAAGSFLGINLASESFPVGKVTFLDLYPMSSVPQVFQPFFAGRVEHRKSSFYSKRLRVSFQLRSSPEMSHRQRA